MGGHVAKGSGPNKKLAKRAAAENVLQVREKQGATAPVLTHVCVVPMKASSSSFPLSQMFRELFSLDKLWNSPPPSLPPHVLYGKGVQNSTKKGSFVVNMAANKRGNCYYLFRKKV